MPVFLASLLGGLRLIAGSIAAQVMVSLGISVVTYAGSDAALDWLKGQAVSSFAGLPVQVVGMLSTMKVGQCISIVFSAIIARQVLNGLSGGKFKKWALK